MVKRINLSIPDELAERLTNHRDNINIFLIFQRDIERKIEQEKKFKKLLQEDIASSIQRLTVENNQHKPINRQEGLKWAKCASYEHLLDTLEYLPGDKSSEWLEVMREFWVAVRDKI